MIIDNIALGGDSAYFNLLATGPNTVAISAALPQSPLGKGVQYCISGIRLQLEADDLLPLFKKQPGPLFRINVYKEMFSCLFANPYEHRVLTISGYEDFNRGVYVNCKTIDVEGIATIVSTGEEKCSWQSPLYAMPTAITIGKIAWDIASSRLTPVNNFTYRLQLQYWTGNDFTQPPLTFDILNNDAVPAAVFSPANPRMNDDLAQLTDKPLAFRIFFSADIKHEASVNESHKLNVTGGMGTPLLRAVYILESMPMPTYEFYSVQELLDHSIDFHLFETPGPAIKKLTATIGINALLAQSDNEVVANGAAPAKYEYAELICFNGAAYTYMEAKANIMVSITPPKAIG